MATNHITFETRNPAKLKNHKLNAEIYGDTADEDFVKSCERGIEVPLLILGDDTIISGHRRMQAARKLKMPSVPVIVRRDLKDALDIEWAFIISNKAREKTTAQLAREAAKLFDIEEKRSAARQKANLKAGAVSRSGTNTGTGKPAENGTLQDKGGDTRDIVGAALGVSGSTAEKLAEVGEEIADLEKKGHGKKADDLEKTANEEGLNAAHRKVEGEKPPKELKDGDGHVVPKNLREAFGRAKTLKSLATSVGKVIKELEASLEQPGGERLPMTELRTDCKNVQHAIKAAIPHAVCPYCKGEGCAKCQKYGWLTFDQFSGIPEERRQKK